MLIESDDELKKDEVELSDDVGVLLPDEVLVVELRDELVVSIEDVLVKLVDDPGVEDTIVLLRDDNIDPELEKVVVALVETGVDVTLTDDDEDEKEDEEELVGPSIELDESSPS